MATYINGVTDYIPQIQEFKPDFNFYAKSLQMSQSKYDANHDKLSSLYGSLLNSPMLREKNIEERDAFFKTIDQDIKRMSGMDLSKQQNVDAASGIFNQMLDNKAIVKDMVWTKNWQKEHQRADGFRNCVDPEKCGGAWWQEGVSALNYRADEFKNATDDEAMGFGSAKFTPYQDVMGKAMKLAKEADLNVTIDQKSGGYIVTTKNGPNLLAKPLASLFMGQLGKDPAIMDYYKTKAYVDRKNWVSSNAPAYGSKEAAQQAYIQQYTQAAGADLDKAETDIKSTQENVSNQRKNLENEIKTKGTTPTSALADMYRAAVGTEQQLGATGDVIKDANGNLKVGLSNAGTRAALSNIDAALAATYLQGDIGKAAMTLSYKDYEQTKEADPYALENVKHANRMALSNLDYKKQYALLGRKFDLDQMEKKIEAQGTAVANEGWSTTPIGGVDVNLDEGAAHTEIIKKQDKLEQEISRNEKELLVEALTTIQQQSRNSDPTKAAGARADLITMGDAMVQEVKKDDPEFLRKYSRYSDDQKIKVLQDFDFNNAMRVVSGHTADAMYDDVLFPMMDMNTKSNTVNRKYLSNLWSSTANRTKRDKIHRKSIVLEQLNNGYKENVAKVKADIKSQDSEFGEWSGAIDAFIDDNGNPKSQKQFVDDYMRQSVRSAAPGESQEAIAYNANMEAHEIWENMDSEDGLMQKWREAYSKHSVVKGQTNTMGGGSQAIEEGRGYLADPVNYLSTASTGFMGAARDVFRGGLENARVAIGGLSAGIPEESSDNAKAILNQLYSDYATRANPNDKKRPILNVTTQAIAGGNSDWMAVNVKVDDDYAAQYTGSKSNKGLLYDNRVNLVKDGITMYIKKSEATNQFYENSKRSDLETLIHYNGSYKIDDFPDIFEGELTKMEGSGGHNLSGMLTIAYDEQGQPIQKPIVNQYWDPDISPDDIMNGFRQELLHRTAYAVKQEKAAYNMQHGTKDPQSLL